MVQVSKEVGAPGLTEAQKQALSAEMMLEVNALRNAAYARGMASAKTAAAAMILGEWA